MIGGGTALILLHLNAALPGPTLLVNRRQMQCADQGHCGPERHLVWTFHVSGRLQHFHLSSAVCVVAD